MAAGLPNIIYRGSHVLTMDDDRTEAEAVAVTDGWTSAVDEVMALAGPETRIDDLHSLTLLRASYTAGRLRLDVVVYPWFDTVAALDRSVYLPGDYDGRLLVGGG
ncbi:MAG: hypothetical protein VYA71_01540, partial [Pseudomonadota bacterium]|nr:hypothetical protein [Pseudomonadota bacterium]